MKKFRWQILIVLVTALVVGLLLYFQQTSPAPVPVSTPSPISGGTYTEALVGEFMRLNPMLDQYNQADRDINRLIFSSLIRFDSAGTPIGDLADTFSYSADGTRYTFSINQNAVWHDGQPVTSRDVVYTVGLLQSNHPLIPEDLRAFWAEITVTAISDAAVEFSLPEGFAPFLDYLNFQVLPSHLLGNLTLDELIDHPFNLAPVGSGPYKFSELVVENGLITGVNLVANEYYYEGRPYIDEFNFRYYADSASALQSYLAGEVDGLAQVNNEQLAQVLAQPGLNLYSSREPRLSIVFLNLNNPAKTLLQEVDFRKALMAATNRQGIIDDLLMGQGVLATGPILPDNWAFYDGQTTYKYDPDLARQLLAGLGYQQNADGRFIEAEGVPVSLALLVQDDPQYTAIAERIRQGWETAGISVELVVKPYDQVIADLQARAYETALVDIDLSCTPDPDPYPFWDEAMAESGQNYAQWTNTTASEYLEQARVQPDRETRIKLYRNFQVLFSEQLPSLPLYYPVYNYAVKNAVQDVSVGPVYDPSDRFNHVATWYIRTGDSTSQPATTVLP